MKIYMNQRPNKCYRNTDYYMVEKFRKLGELFPDLEFYYPHSRWYGMLGNLIDRWNVLVVRTMRLVNRNLSFLRFSPLERRTLSGEYQSGKFDMIFMRGGEYVDIRKRYADRRTIVFWEALFIDPEHTDGGHWAANKEHWELDVKLLKERSADERTVINLRSDYSIALARRMFPEAKATFVNLFFPIDNRQERMASATIEHKHLSLKPEHPIHFLICGEEAERKGLQHLMAAFRRLRHKYRNRVELTVVSRQAVRLFPDISREEGVNYRGALPHEQVLEEFRRAHAYVMPSRYETFGLSYVEGLAHGCVVIARDFEPQREMLDYGRSGLLVNPFSVDDIYAAMSRVVEMNNRERLDWAMRGYEKFLRAYSFETVSRQWYDVFHEIGMRSKENK